MQAGNERRIIKLDREIRDTQCSTNSIVKCSLLECHEYSGGATAVKEPGHFEVRKFSNQITRNQGVARIFSWSALFPQKS